jgi:predicted Zn-dependent protease
MRLFVRILSVRILLLSTALTVGACSVNPVTGDRELMLMSASQEVNIGEQNYQPYQQQQGGQYYVDPEVNLYVNKVGQKLAQVSDRRDLPYEFVVINNSVPNAWALPGGKIAINRGLLLLLEDEAQLAAVLAHEIIHAAARHTAQQMTQSTLLGLGVQVAGIASRESEYGQLIGLGAQLGAGAWQARHSRSDELEADRYGIKYMVEAGYNPQGAVELQETFVRLAEGKQSGWLEALFASHPPSQRRVEENRELAAQYGREGVRNKDAYLEAIDQLREDADAYETHLKAEAALRNKDPVEAQRLATRAIEMQPAEALFYNTKGQALVAQGKDELALLAFQLSSRKNPDHFMGYLGQGLMEKKLGKYQEAATDLQRSVELLPTQIGVFHLGELAQMSGNRQKAVEYYQFAAQGGGELGQTAQQRLAELAPQSQQQLR